MNCPKCHAVSLNEEVCSSCGIIFSKFEKSIDQQKSQKRQGEFAALTGDFIPPSVELWLPPIAFVLGILILWMMPFLTWMMCMWPHEFGHAFAGWLGGVASTPIPFAGFTSYSGTRSWIVTGCFSTLLILLSYKCWKPKSYFLIFTFLGLFIAQFYYRFQDADRLRMWQAYGGIGGEFWISAWLIMAYHYRFPEKTYWHVFRPIFLLMGSITFFHNMHLWIAISHGKAQIPWGALWGGHGDMNQLVDNWGWTPPMITESYLRLGYICLAILVLHYVLKVGLHWISTPKKR